jgi:hypothetical protein
MFITQDEQEHLNRADRLIAEGVRGDRQLIAAMIFEVAVTEREACARIADSIGAQDAGESEPDSGALAAQRIAAAIRSRND